MGIVNVRAIQPLELKEKECCMNAIAEIKSQNLQGYLEWAVSSGDPFALAVIENLSRYPVSVGEFITSDTYLGLKNVYPVVIESLEDIYHPHVDGLGRLRIGTTYREVLLTGSLGCAKTFTSVIGILYGIYLLSCLRNPHALFGLDSNSEIVILFQSIRFQTGGVAYKLAREMIDGSQFFTKHFPKDQRNKNEILLPKNIVIRPVSGELTAAIGMNVATVLLDEMSYMRYHAKSVYAEDGGAYDQARALYAATRGRIDSRFAKLGKYLIPMWLAGSARHQDDFIQTKVREAMQLSSLGENADSYVYNKTVWQVKPFNYPSKQTFRVYLGEGTTPPQIVEKGSPLYKSEHIIDVPVEEENAFKTQAINIALRDICGIPGAEIGNFIVESERAKARFNRDNIFVTESCTFLNGDLPKVRKGFKERVGVNIDRIWFCHLDLSRTTDSTGIAIGYVEKFIEGKPKIIIAGLLEVKPVPGHVIPWDEIIQFLFRLSNVVPLYGISADQVGYNYLREQVVPYGYRTQKISDNPRSEIFHNFLNVLIDGDISIANHSKTQEELLALNVDGKTSKVTKPAGGSKDCADALVSLVELLKTIPRHLHDPNNWREPEPPENISEVCKPNHSQELQNID